MPRKPTKRRSGGGSSSRPLVFSSFGRSVARVASQRKQSTPFLHRKDTSQTPGNDPTKKAMKEKTTHPESSSEEDEKTIQADFVFFDPKPEDFHGVKTLLQHFLDNKKWDLSGFVDLILSQTAVGTVIKIEDDEDDTPFSIVTAINLGQYKEDHKCIMEVKDFLLEVCQKDVTGDLKNLLEERAHKVGLLVSQHVVNLPPQLLPPLYDALFDEVSWATEDEPSEELRESFRFKFYLIPTKVYKHKTANQRRGKSKGSNEDPIIYIKPEDEIFHKLCLWSFTFALRTEQPSDQELKNYRRTGLVMAIEAKKIPIFRQELHSLINGD